MKDQLKKGWWFLTIKGILLILFGLVALLYPGEVISTIVLYLGLLIFIEGVLFIIGAIYNKKRQKAWELWMLEGIMDAIIGLFFIVYPGLTMKVFIIIIGIWAVMLGVYQIITYFTMEAPPRNRFFYLVNGLLAILMGVFMISNPFDGGKLITVTVGIFSLIFGVMLTVTSIKMRETVKKG